MSLGLGMSMSWCHVTHASPPESKSVATWAGMDLTFGNEVSGFAVGLPTIFLISAGEIGQVLLALVVKDSNRLQR